MAQAKRGPKAKPKVVEQEIEFPTLQEQLLGNNWPSHREQRVWELSRDLLLNRARTASPITPVAIVELAGWAKLLDKEIGG